MKIEDESTSRRLTVLAGVVSVASAFVVVGVLLVTRGGVYLVPGALALPVLPSLATFGVYLLLRGRITAFVHSQKRGKLYYILVGSILIGGIIGVIALVIIIWLVLMLIFVINPH
jgi:hypothetical protein